MMNNALVEKAIMLATVAHAGQVDKIGFPYILHPLRVMSAVTWRENGQGNAVMELGYDFNAMIVAALHDVCEYTEMIPAGLVEQGFGPEIIIAIQLLTRAPAGSPGRLTYMQYIHAIHEAYYIADNDVSLEGARIAKRVKIADLNDNLSRIECLPVAERDIERRYKRALAVSWEG